jgi:hypothetical protein
MVCRGTARGVNRRPHPLRCAELEPIELWAVAEHFDVPVDVLEDHPRLRCPIWDT